jgi:hypothetical protein
MCFVSDCVLFLYKDSVCTIYLDRFILRTCMNLFELDKLEFEAYLFCFSVLNWNYMNLFELDNMREPAIWDLFILFF